jgi:hypothetical protein
MKKKATIWWGNFHVEEQNPRLWEIGPLQLQIKRNFSEWLISHYSNDDTETHHISVGLDKCAQFPTDKLLTKRFIFKETNSSIALMPILADRSQVSHAETPFYVAPNEHVTIYVSSPIWIRIETGNPKLPLMEIPSLRQSDTWHGRNTQEGELCYASRTFCRTNLDELPARSNRVISPIVIHNTAKLPLLIEQLSLPLPFLSIYADVHGNLWTEEIIVRNEPNHKHTIKQGKGAPHIAHDAALIAEPRQHLKTHNLITMFYSLLLAE